MRYERFAGKALKVGVLGTMMTLGVPALALAEEEHSGLDLLIPNMVEFIPMLIAFLLLWVVFAKFAYPTVMGMIDKRANMIKDNLQSAEESKVEASKLKAQSEQELEGAKTEAAQIVEDAKKSAQAQSSKIQTDAHEQAQAILDKANVVIENNRQVAAAELQKSVADISIAVASKLIGKDLSDEEHRKIVERYVEEAGSLNVG